MNTKKRLIGIFAIILIILVSIGYFIIRNKNTSPQTELSTTEEPESVVPTVDASTLARLKPLLNNKEVQLSVIGIPNNTNSIDYELSYSTKSQGFQGVIGSLTTKKGQSQIDKQITLGTCSSGKCVYHEVLGEIKVTLKFTGEYGEKILEKSFTL